MTAYELLAALHEQGFILTPLPGGKLEVKPAGRLTATMREAVRRYKPEILAVMEAAAWLRAKLTPGPQRIAPLIAEWCGGQRVRQRDGTWQWEGGRDGTNGRWIHDVTAARRMLDVEAYAGLDGRMWWRLPQALVQQDDDLPDLGCQSALLAGCA